jgi:GT2 family glycosyltransferase
MITILEEHPEYAGVGPMIYTLDNHICGPFCNRPTPFSMTLGIGIDLKYRKSQINTSRPVYRLFGCCMLLDNETMKQVDYLDERTFLYCEEDILAERVLKVGKTFYYDSNVSIKHMESSSLRYSVIKLKTNIKYVIDSRNIYMKEYRNWNCVIRFLVNTTYALKRYYRNAKRNRKI